MVSRCGDLQHPGNHQTNVKSMRPMWKPASPAKAGMKRRALCWLPLERARALCGCLCAGRLGIGGVGGVLGLQPPGADGFRGAWSSPIFHMPERRVRARGLQERRCVLVGRVPSRGARLAFPSECEICGPVLVLHHGRHCAGHPCRVARWNRSRAVRY